MYTSNHTLVSAAIVLLILVFPTVSLSVEVNFVSESLVRSYERDTSTKTDIAVLPIYEYMQVETGSLTKPGLSVHAYGWGRTDMGDRDFFDDNETGELLYGYMEYTDDRYSFKARLGRQSLFGGPVNEIIDGFSVSGEPVKTLAVTFFGGMPTSLAEENGTSGDLIYGTKLAHRFLEKHDLALSYRKIESNSTSDDEIVGLDMFFALPNEIDFSGMSSRSLEEKKWREHFYEARMTVKEINVRPYLQQLEYDGFFNTKTNSADPFRYLASTGETLSTAGVDMAWMGIEGWEFGVKSKYHDFANRNGEAIYLSGLATWHSEEMSMVGGEAGIMEGDDPRDEYLLARIFSYWDEIPFELPISFVTTDLIYVDYGKKIKNKGNSLFFSLGGGMRFLDDALEVKLSADYSSDPYYKEDYRSTLVVTYRYADINEDEE